VTELALLNANILDVEAGTIIGERTVHISDGCIEEVLVENPGNAKRSVDLKGLTLMPGLCDGHVHVTAATADFSLLTAWSPAYVAAREGEFGVIKAGARADLIAVAGNPLDDLQVLQSPDENLKMVMKRGALYKQDL
jgi:imidazolonepropionase-like amidohydrolase